MPKKSEAKLSQYKKIMLVLLALCAMNFAAKFFYFVYLAFALYCFKEKKIYCPNALYLYVVFCVLYALCAISGGPMGVLRRLGFAMFFTIGYGAVDREGKGDNERWARASLTALAAGTFIHLLLNYWLNARQNLGRNGLDVWSGEVMSATGQAALACLAVGLSAAWFVFPKRRTERYLAIIIAALIMLYNLVLGGRTIFVLFAVSLLACLLYMNKVVTEKGRKQKLFGAIILVAGIAIIAYSFDMGGLRTTIKNSNFYARFQGALTVEEWTEDGRMENKILYLKNLLQYPFGGTHMREKWGYAHDLVLDLYDEAGILVTLPMLGILVAAVKDSVLFVRYANVSYYTKAIYIGILVTILLEFFVEPIFAGMPWIFACFAFIHGSMCAMIHAAERV